MTLRQIYNKLRNEGEVVIGNIELIWDGFGTEVSKDDEYQFTASSWFEVVDYLTENEVITNA